MVTVPDDLYQQIDNYRFTHKCRSQTQAINELIQLGLQQLADEKKEPVNPNELSSAENETLTILDGLSESNRRLLLGIGALILQEQEKPLD